MRRREFIAVFGGCAVAGPHIVRAQQPRRTTPLVGALWLGEPTAPITLSVMKTFRQGLREGGYVEGKNIVIEHRYGLNKFREAADDFVRDEVDVIAASGTPGAFAAKRATSVIPIVAANMADPVGDGLVSSLARPGGNLTGNTFIGPELGPKRLQLLREVVSGVARIAALQQPHIYSEQTMRDMLAELEEGARDSGVALEVFNAGSPDAFENAFDGMVKAQSGAVIVLPSPMFYVNYRRLVELAASRRLPTVYVFREAVTAGGLMCYGADIPDLSRRAARYVASILQGAKPGDLPVERPTKFDFVINLKTAKALGLTVSSLLLAQADEVIE